MSTPRTASCLFCGTTATLRSVTAAVQLDCPSCGNYEVTVGAISVLRDTGSKARMLIEVRRQHESGIERPSINLELIKSLNG